MIQFPIGLKAHKKFNHSGHAFFADIEAGCVFEINDVVSDILDMCESSTTAEVEETLRLKYQVSEISHAFRYLYQLQMAGILLHQTPMLNQEDIEFSGRIIVPPSFLNQLDQKPFLTRVAYHHLFKALSGELEVFIPISNTEGLSPNFDWEGITPLEIPTEHKTFALPRGLPVKEFIQQLPENLLSLLRFLAILLCVEFFAYQSRSPFTFFHLMLAILLSYALERTTKKFGIKAYIIYPVYFVPVVVILILYPFLLQAYWKKFLLFAGVYRLILPIISTYMLNLDMSCLSTLVPIEDLQPGMIPAEKIIGTETDEGTSYRKEPAVVSDSFDKNVLVSPVPEGLSDESVQELKELANLGSFDGFGGTLAIQHSVHFAPIILTGTLLTILCGGVFYAPII